MRREPPLQQRHPRDRQLAPVITRLEGRIADLADQIVGHEAAQEDLRKLVQSQFDKLAQRLDATKQASEAATQRAQNQAVRLAQEELRKLVQSERSLFAQRMDALKQASEAAAQRAQDQAVQQAQTDLRDLEGRLRDDVESLGQRVDDLTVKAASEHDLSSLRVAIEKLSARIAQGPDLKPLADFDRRLTDFVNKLEQNRGNPIGRQIDAADLDKRIAVAMQQNQVSPPWTGIEHKLAGISDRLAITEMRLQHIATLEKWILQLYESLEQTLDWTRNVAEDAANRMANRLVQEWSSETGLTTTSAEVEALENELATVRSEDGAEFDQCAAGRNRRPIGMTDTTIFVVTSDEARNGKSLFARFLVDYLILAKRNPIVFDAGSPHQHMKQRWPGRALSADFSKVQGQMAFFDRVLGMPPRDGVLDLSRRDLQLFLSLAKDIEFRRELTAKGLGLELFFVETPSLESRRLLERIRAMRLFHAMHFLRPAIVKGRPFSVLKLRETAIVIPELSPSLVARIEQPGFSVEAFLRGREQGLNFFEAKEFEAFLDKVMGGIDAIVTAQKERR
jgi:hypothetical protein